MWATAGADGQSIFVEQAKQLRLAYEQEMSAFKKSDKWQAYMKATRIRMVPKTKSKGKAKAKPAVGPRIPASMPKKPSSAFQNYCTEKQGAGMRIPELLKEYQNLPDKAAREEAANSAKEQYQSALATWEK